MYIVPSAYLPLSNNIQQTTAYDKSNLISEFILNTDKDRITFHCAYLLGLLRQEERETLVLISFNPLQ